MSMANDKEQQCDELLTLKAIFDNAIIDLGNDGDQFEVNVELQLLSPLRLRLVDSSHQLSAMIRYLPPIVLTIHFHESYPSSDDSPTFVLSSFYLSYSYLERLCKKLDKIWLDNISQPIVYQWIECLKDEFISVDELCLSTVVEQSDDNDDPRAMSSYEHDQAARVYRQLLDYDQEKDNEHFLHDYHECSICMTANMSGHDMIRLHKCHHVFCRLCLNNYARMQISTGPTAWLSCPDVDCQLSLLPVEIRTILQDQSLYDKYERLLLQKTLENMDDIAWCPR
jgi:E3 ubiquitin-protein ligase RNF14